jgi:hypothetical protein
LSDEERSCVQEERNVTSMETFLVVLFFLAAGGATKDGAFLLSEVQLIRVGSIVAYLAINWARVVDLNPRAEIGPAVLYAIALARGAGTVFCKEWQRSWLVKKGMLGKRKRISVLPLKLVGNQASTQDKRSALAHWRCGHEILATKWQRENELLLLVRGTKDK